MMKAAMYNVKRGRVWLAIRLMALAGLVLVSLGAAGLASAATLLTESTWGGPSDESTGGAAVAADGSTYLAGFTSSFGDGDLSVFVVKFAPDGTLVWQRTWDGPEQFGSDAANDVDVAPDGSVYVAGYTQGTGGDALLLKFSPDGTLLWQRTWGGSASDRAEAVAVAPDGSVYIAGGTTSFGGGNSQIFAARFAPDGTLVWQRAWGLDGFADGQGVAVAPDGSVYVAGVATRPGGAFEFDIVLLKLDGDGNLMWQQAYSAGEIADARGGVAVGPDGSIYVAGGIQQPRSRIVDLNTLLLKFSPDGTLVWDREWGGRSGDEPADVAVASDGTVLLAGNTNSYGAGSDDAFLIQVRPDGRGLGGNTWGGTGTDHSGGVDSAPDGTISLGATAHNPPYTFDRVTDRLSRARGTIATPSGVLSNATGIVSEPAGIVETPSGSTTYAGGHDAALLRIAP
ncbi:MAG TPA: hypothetical protein VEW94_04975 [Chloroflexia bacterium]|nr:hypothetical protein [Chloroflexia bacterium]